MFNICNSLVTIYVKDSSAQSYINARLADINRTGVNVEIKA